MENSRFEIGSNGIIKYLMIFRAVNSNSHHSGRERELYSEKVELE